MDWLTAMESELSPQEKAVVRLILGGGIGVRSGGRAESFAVDRAACLGSHRGTSDRQGGGGLLLVRPRAPRSTVLRIKSIEQSVTSFRPVVSAG